MSWYFNPRSREGSDPRPKPRGGAPPYFNPRSREGSDVTALPEIAAAADFNPRSREGSDLTLKQHVHMRVPRFQSTLP